MVFSVSLLVWKRVSLGDPGPILTVLKALVYYIGLVIVSKCVAGFFLIGDKSLEFSSPISFGAVIII